MRNNIYTSRINNAVNGIYRRVKTMLHDETLKEEFNFSSYAEFGFDPRDPNIVSSYFDPEVFGHDRFDYTA